MLDPTTLPVRPRGLTELRELIGTELGPTEWHEVTQERIDAFAGVTGDHQWIHVDPERAAASPLGTTIAHGLYSLSLGPQLTYRLVSFEGFAHSLNYGYDRVRFPAHLPAGGSIRMRLTVLDTEEVSGGIQVRMRQTFELADGDKPVAVADALARLVERQ